MFRKFGCVLSLLFLASANLYAQQTVIPPGRWDKLEKEKPGTGIVVTLHDGQVIECTLKSLSADALTIITDEPSERVLPKTMIAKVVSREKRSGPLWNGAVVGASIPAAIGLIGCSVGHGGDACYIATAIWTGVGAAIGIGVDALKKGQVTLYRARGSK